MWGELIAIMLVVIIGFFTITWITADEKKHPPVCLEKTKVVSIDSINYRGATITLDNGHQNYVYQATLKPGDFYCYKWKKYN